MQHREAPSNAPSSSHCALLPVAEGSERLCRAGASARRSSGGSQWRGGAARVGLLALAMMTILVPVNSSATGGQKEAPAAVATAKATAGGTGGGASSGASKDDPALMDPPPNTQYTVITHAAVRPAHRTDFVTMRDKAGRDFECVLPSALTASQDLEEASKTAEKEDAPEEEAAEIPPLDSFLAPLAGRCFLRNEGYWSFEVCHRKKVRQFHEEGKRASLEYSLGDFSRHESPPVTAENARTVVVKHWFAGGTPCDETVEPRQTVIEYRCGQARAPRVLCAHPFSCASVPCASAPRECRLTAGTRGGGRVRRTTLRRFARCGAPTPRTPGALRGFRRVLKTGKD